MDCFAKDRFDIDLDAETVTCPAGVTAPIRRQRDGSRIAAFGAACAGLPAGAPSAPPPRRAARHRRPPRGRPGRAPAPASRPGLAKPTTGPPAPRSNAKSATSCAAATAAAAHGSAARLKVAADFRLLAAAVNLARLAVLGLHLTPTNGWTATA